MSAHFSAAKVLDVIRDCAPYNMELRYDGSEDKYAAAYVAGVHTAYNAVKEYFDKF